jgi:hypothetical protein
MLSRDCRNSVDDRNLIVQSKGIRAMKKNSQALLLIVFLVARTLTAEPGVPEKTEKKFRFANPRAKNVLVVDNVFGSIKVSGTKNDEVIVSMDRTIEAKTAEQRKRAEEEVYIDIVEDGDYLELYVDGPFRDGHRRSRRSGSWRSRHYEVHYDFEIRIPENTEIVLKTVNDGEIVVKGVQGQYEIGNVNGGIRMEGVGGSGDVYTVNGDVFVEFNRNPKEDSRFGTLNGELRMIFLPRLSADFLLETFNGEVYSDFTMEYVPHERAVEVERNGKTVYKTGKGMRVRTGRGGPQIHLDGFNGDMYILEKK